MTRPQPKRWLNVRPLLLALLATILLGSAHTAEAQTASEQTVETRKSPWVAFALSFLVKSRVVCKSERKLLDASVRLPWRPPWARGVRGPGNGARSRAQ